VRDGAGASCPVWQGASWSVVEGEFASRTRDNAAYERSQVKAAYKGEVAALLAGSDELMALASGGTVVQTIRWTASLKALATRLLK
jgi:hypothetical protein